MRLRAVGYLFVTLLVAAIAVACYSVPQIRARLSWYEMDPANLLVTCAAQTPAFRTIGFAFDANAYKPSFSSLEVFLACQARDHSLRRGAFNRTTVFGGNLALNQLVDRAAWCSGWSNDVPPQAIARCRKAHFDAIDWLLSQGIINAGELTTVLGTPIGTIDDEMFAFLLSRGADPQYHLPEIQFHADRRSAADLLSIELGRLNAKDFPEQVSALRRMQKLADTWPATPNNTLERTREK